MNRRGFSIIAAKLLSLAIVGGCERRHSTFATDEDLQSIPPFSKDRFHSRLETLRAAFEGQGMHVSDSLLPPVSESELRLSCKWFPGVLPQELVALYGWHEGQEKGAWDEDFPFWFRDCAFSRIAVAESEYHSMMESYGTIPTYHDLLKYSFPFAAFNGQWFVIPTRGQKLDDRLTMPIISVGEGVDIYFYSIELLVNTCIEWVRHPSYTAKVGLPREVELEIWEKHNPGIFGI